jgi:hypothetical protein
MTAGPEPDTDSTAPKLLLFDSFGTESKIQTDSKHRRSDCECPCFKMFLLHNLGLRYAARVARRMVDMLRS